MSVNDNIHVKYAIMKDENAFKIIHTVRQCNKSSGQKLYEDCNNYMKTL